MGIYIRSDKRKNKTYYWLVESHRQGKKVVQRRIKSLGTNPPSTEFRQRLAQVGKPDAWWYELSQQQMTADLAATISGMFDETNIVGACIVCGEPVTMPNPHQHPEFDNLDRFARKVVREPNVTSPVDWRPPPARGKRIIKPFGELVRLCWLIGKSPFTIKKVMDPRTQSPVFFMDIRSKSHLTKLIQHLEGVGGDPLPLADQVCPCPLRLGKPIGSAI